MALLRMGSGKRSCAFLSLRAFYTSRCPGSRQSASDLGSPQHWEVPTSLRISGRVRRTICCCLALTRPSVQRHVSESSWPVLARSLTRSANCRFGRRYRPRRVLTSLREASEPDLSTSGPSAPPGSRALWAGLNPVAHWLRQSSVWNSTLVTS